MERTWGHLDKAREAPVGKRGLLAVHFRFGELAELQPVSAKVQRQLKEFASLTDFLISLFLYFSISMFWYFPQCLIKHFKKQKCTFHIRAVFPLDTCQSWWKLIFASNKFFCRNFVLQKSSTYWFKYSLVFSLLLWGRWQRIEFHFSLTLVGWLSKEFAIWVFRIYINSHFWQVAQNWEA